MIQCSAVIFHYFKCPLILYSLLDSSFWFDIVNLGRSIVYIKGSQVIILKNVFLSLMIVFVLANNIDPDEMSHYIAHHQGLHYLPV